MAIQLSVINFIVPIETIENKYPGGWEQCLFDHGGSNDGGPIWYDDYLFRNGAMNQIDILMMLERWKALGFRTHKGGKNPKWLDVCIICAFFDKPTMPCDWIVTDGAIAYMKDKPIGEVIGWA